MVVRVQSGVQGNLGPGSRDIEDCVVRLGYIGNETKGYRALRWCGERHHLDRDMWKVLLMGEVSFAKADITYQRLSSGLLRTFRQVPGRP